MSDFSTPTLQHQLATQQLNSILALLPGVSTEAKVKGSVPQGCHQVPGATCTSDRPVVSVAFSLTLLVLSDWLESLTEPQKIFYLHLRVYHKGYDSGAAKWKPCIGQGMGWRGAGHTTLKLSRGPTLSHLISINLVVVER